MSQSPRESEDVEPAPPSVDENEQQDNDQADESEQQNDSNRNQQQQDEAGNTSGAKPDMSRPEDQIYDFEVKEQDRWLPIANGEFILSRSLYRTFSWHASIDLSRRPLITTQHYHRIPSTTSTSNPSYAHLA